MFEKGKLDVVSIEHDQAYKGGMIRAIFAKGAETLIPHNVQEELDKKKEALSLRKLLSNTDEIETLREHVLAEL